MGFWDRIFGTDKHEQRMAEIYLSQMRTLNDTSIISGQDVEVTTNEDVAMKISALFAGVNIISEAVASLPMYLYRKTETGREVVEDDIRNVFFTQETNPQMTAFVAKQNMVKHILMRGNCYLLIDRDKFGDPIRMYPIHPDRVYIKKKFYDNGELDISFLITAEEKHFPYKYEDVLVVARHSEDGLTGQGVLHFGGDAISLATSEGEYLKNMYDKGTTIKGYIKSPTALSREAKQNLSKSWSMFYSGTANAGKTALLEEGLEFVPLSLSPADLEVVQSRQFNIQEIARLLNIPPHMLGDLSRATFSNIEHQSIEFLNYTLRPILHMIEQACNKTLLKEDEKGEYYFEFDVTGMLLTDQKSLVESLKEGLNSGLYTLNEARAKMNLSETDGGDIHLVPLNVAILKDGVIHNPNANEQIQGTTDNKNATKQIVGT